MGGKGGVCCESNVALRRTLCDGETVWDAAAGCEEGREPVAKTVPFLCHARSCTSSVWPVGSSSTIKRRRVGG